MDSRATWHTTPNQDWFHTYEPISKGSRALVVLRKIAANLFVLMREIHHKVEASIASASPLEEKTMM
jgi:hypothetical protein